MSIFEQMEKARVMLNKAVDGATPEIKEAVKDQMLEINKTIINGNKNFNDTVNGNSNNK